MPVFICRWPNVDFSAVQATSRDDAALLLDEVGNDDNSELFTVRNFLATFC
jgi:hypothetical protein